MTKPAGVSARGLPIGAPRDAAVLRGGAGLHAAARGGLLGAGRRARRGSRAISVTSHLQGDHSGCAKPPIDLKMKVTFQYEANVLKCNLCFQREV